jgi:hypothetical protein
MSIPPDAQKKSDVAFAALQAAVDEALDRKRRLDQYWVVWDGEKPVEVHPGADKPAAAE